MDPKAITKEELLAFYKDMRAIRIVEQMAAKAYSIGGIKGFCHLYIGEESVAVGTAAATKDDYWITAYREHGQAMAKGVDPNAMMAEMFGKAAGTSKGLGGSMHIFDKKHRFMGGWGIVGGHVPLANGVGWAIRHRNEERVCVCFFGDGATHQGAFFEALCLAQLYKLPCIFICENNGYAMGTSIERQSALIDLHRRAEGVGMKHEQFDGYDVELVRDRVAAAREYAVSGKGPVFLEIMTYRHRGHSMSDPAKYRPDGELEEKKKSDPLTITEDRLVKDFGISQEELKAIQKEVDTAAKATYNFADEATELDPNTIYDFVYAD